MDVYGQCAEISMCYDDHASVMESLAAKPTTASTAGKNFLLVLNLEHQYFVTCNSITAPRIYAIYYICGFIGGDFSLAV